MPDGSRIAFPLPPGILPRASELMAALESLKPLGRPALDDPRSDALLLLGTKVLPELRHERALPVFVGVQGGTNTGKSTVFNALSGKLLSPSLVTGSATKHPLIFAHESWRDEFLGGQVFPGVRCRELSDPKELIVDPETSDVIYFRFHGDPGATSFAIIDSPDFDSDLASNALGAAAIAAISDISIFVTTAQKYRDRILVAQLRRLLELKGEVIIIFNMVEEPIVYETVLDDLRSILPGAGEGLRALRISPSRARHPEDEIREALQAEVLGRAGEWSAEGIKPRVILRTARRILDLADEAVASRAGEAALKREIRKAAEAGAEECRREYSGSFCLGLPEETLAITRILRITELSRFLELGGAIERAQKPLALVGAALRKLNETVRRVMVRISRSDEGSVDPASGSLEEYARARNASDGDSVFRLVEALRVKVEGLVRSRETASALARELLRTYFTPEMAGSFPSRVREAHAEALRATPGTGEEILPHVETWIASSPRTVQALAISAITFKLLLGGLLAAALPPATGLLGILHPLKWLYFAAGYLLAAYAIALLVCLRMRRQKRFRRARERAMDLALQAAFLDPLHSAMDAIITEKELRAVRTAARGLEEALGRMEVPETAPA